MIRERRETKKADKWSFRRIEHPVNAKGLYGIEQAHHSHSVCLINNGEITDLLLTAKSAKQLCELLNSLDLEECDDE